MSDFKNQSHNPSLGIIGFGVFGQLVAANLSPHFKICAFDLAPDLARAEELGVSVVDFPTVAESAVVILAIPVGRMRMTTAELALYIKPGTLVLDVGSVKVEPVAAMSELLPRNVQIVATHPLFGPQSAAAALADCKLRFVRFADPIGGLLHFVENWDWCQRRSKIRPGGGAKLGHLWRTHETSGRA
jgi:prephenate dehydrogenase